jgi:hypothetical protein
MADYERLTALPTQEIFRRTEDILTTRGGLSRTRESAHGVTYSGGEGTVSIDVHRHGPVASVTARTNQLRTSKIDNVVRYLLNQLPYQPGDPARE